MTSPNKEVAPRPRSRSPGPGSVGTLDQRELLRALQRVRDGDFSVRLPGDWTGLDGKIADTFNEIVAANAARWPASSSASATSSASRARPASASSSAAAAAPGAQMEASVNTLIDDLLWPTTEVTRAIAAVAQGDLLADRAPRRRRPAARGRVPALGDHRQHDDPAARRVHLRGDARGARGRHRRQARRPGAGAATSAASGRTSPTSVNSMASNLTAQVRNIAEVTIAVANGDLSKKITVDVRGEILQLKEAINTMVDQLRSFASEVTRVAREVGTDGKLGGQAIVPGVAGTWKDLTDSVNAMCGNLTGQVRNIAEVTTAVARGDLSRKITVDVRGEILELKDTINTMVDQLNAFASEVTRVAREVGTDGKLGGQAQVPGVAGTWKDLTDNVNFMASNLTGAGAQHRRGRDRHRQRRPLEEDHRQRQRRDPASSRRPSTRWSTSSTRSPAR